MRTIFTFVAMPVVLWLGCVSIASSEDDVANMSKIKDSWELRTQKVNSAVFKWAETQVANSANSATGPTVTPLEMTLSFKANKVRFVRKGRYPDELISTDSNETIYCFNGDVSKTFIANAVSSDSSVYPAGFIAHKGKFSEGVSTMLAPLILTFRGLSPELGGIDIAKCKIGKETIVNEHKCVLIESTDSTSVSRLYYLDPLLDYCVVKLAITVEGKNAVELSVKYGPNEKCGFIPISWEQVTLNTMKGTVIRTERAEVKSAVLNVPLEDSQFDITFPSGSLVRDGIAKKQYIVRDDQPPREVLKAELSRGATYPELLKTETGDAGRLTSGSVSNTRIAIVAVATLLVFVLAATKLTQLFGPKRAGAA